MSTLALMSGAEALEKQMETLAETEPTKAFLISWKLKKIAEKFEKNYKQDAVNYWDENKELPANFILKTSSTGKKFAFETDSKWQLLNANLKAREELIKQATLAPNGIDVFDELGEKVPRVKMTEGVKHSFSQK